MWIRARCEATGLSTLHNNHKDRSIECYIFFIYYRNNSGNAKMKGVGLVTKANLEQYTILNAINNNILLNRKQLGNTDYSIQCMEYYIDVVLFLQISDDNRRQEQVFNSEAISATGADCA